MRRIALIAVIVLALVGCSHRSTNAAEQRQQFCQATAHTSMTQLLDLPGVNSVKATAIVANITPDSIRSDALRVKDDLVHDTVTDDTRAAAGRFDQGRNDYCRGDD